MDNPLVTTAQLLEKEVMTVLPPSLPSLREEEAEKELLKSLTIKVLELMRDNFDELVNTLYRVDVSEEKAREAFLEKSDILIAEKLARLLYERTLQKVLSRQQFSKQNKNDTLRR